LCGIGMWKEEKGGLEESVSHLLQERLALLYVGTHRAIDGPSRLYRASIPSRAGWMQSWTGNSRCNPSGMMKSCWALATNLCELSKLRLMANV